jgi:asparagine synthetase B (glutamine-hydrolysing)
MNGEIYNFLELRAILEKKGQFSKERLIKDTEELYNSFL